MKFHQSILQIPVTASDLYRLHQNIDSKIRETYLGDAATSAMRHQREAVPDYSFRAVERRPGQSIVMVRSASQLHLPGEKALQSVIAQEGIVRFSTLMCVTSKLRGRSFVKPEADIPEHVIRPRLERAGLGNAKIQLSGVEHLPVRKPKGKAFTLAGGHTLVEAEVIDPQKFEDAFLHGVGSKTAFGFGFLMVDQT